MDYSVGEVARLAGVTVRTLHHYDEVGLLRPGGRTPSGHRRYGDADLDRLQQVLFYRELGFPLDDIAAVLDGPERTPTEHLRRHHRMLTERIGRLTEMAAAVERAMEARRMGIDLTPEEKFELFGPEYEGWADEAEQNWGGTEQWRQSQRRTAGYTKEDWVRIKEEGDDLNRRLAEAVDAGTDPRSGPAMDLAEEHRQQIVRHFYDCSYAVHRGIGDMYLADPRFTATYEQVRAGLAQWLRDAVHANADRAEGGAGEG
ncbi:MerR family transcriptional regulator [Streptomyces sp. NPDC001380]|uniref:MerR family transcriptional regulator n=1 Tax=Streptomyces sp. NPDC001380 TaxID=3364566 RepID=UPI0036A2F54B